MKKFSPLLLLLIAHQINAQVSIASLETPFTVVFTGFTGSGFSPAPAVGQLDADDWAATGFSDGNLVYGGTKTTGDYARGAISGGVTTGGIYALSYDVNNQALWIQPAAADFNPGTITLRAINNTGSIINELAIAYSAIILNDANRSSSLSFSYSLDDVTYTAVSALDITSESTLDDSLNTFQKSTTINALSIANGQFFYLRWSSQDVSGLGPRDELGLDNISITASQTTVTCGKPTNTNAINITGTTATITWDAIPNATKYKLQYRVMGNSTWTSKNSVANSKNITPLTPNTTYEYKVKTICSNLKSGFSQTKNFTTLPLKTDEGLLMKNLSVYPNPGKGMFLISIPENENGVTIQIYNELGREVKNIQNDLNKLVAIDLTDMPTGVYLLKVTYGTEEKMLKVIRE